MNWSI